MKTKIKLEIDYLYNLHLFLSLYSAVRCAVLTAPMEKTVKKTAAIVLMETAILPQESVSVTLASMGHSKSHLSHAQIKVILISRPVFINQWIILRVILNGLKMSKPLNKLQSAKQDTRND